MICPYNRKSETSMEQYENEFVSEDSDSVKAYKKSYIVKFEQMECQKENCGAYHNGCRFNQGVLEV